MPRELLIAAGPGEWRAALVEDGAAVELHVERGDVRPAGSIHLARVVRLAPGLEAAFVEIGDAKPGMLPLRETAADGLRLDEGARVVAQIRREAQQGKGARLSTRLRPPHPEFATTAAAPDPPTQLDPPPGFATALALRLGTVPERVLADDRAIVSELRAAFPNAETRFAEPADWPVDIDAAIDAALAPSLPLPGGGALHVDETHAAALVDVDTGPAERGMTAANLAAARLLAAHIRLRGLGGGIVVDFAGLEGRGPRERVRAALAAALAADPRKPELLGWTRLGHLELVRPRRFRSLSEIMLDPRSPAGKSALTVAYDALRSLQLEARARPGANWRLTVSPSVETALRGAAHPALRALEARLARDIELIPGAAGERGFDIASR